MKAIATCALVAALAVAPMGTCLSAQSRLALTVRLYNSSGLRPDELLAARDTADAILSDTGLDLTFRHCGTPVTTSDPPDACSEPLKPFEVVVRIINAPAFSATLHPDAYGVAYVVKETDRGWLATMFSDRIDEAAARVRVNPGALLGLVMAHELGHLLLGAGYHGDTGVMRAEWSDALLNRSAEQWRFSGAEAARIRHAAGF